jgi:hypothetical protein
VQQLALEMLHNMAISMHLVKAADAGGYVRLTFNTVCECIHFAECLYAELLRWRGSEAQELRLLAHSILCRAARPPQHTRHTQQLQDICMQESCRRHHDKV